MHRRIGASNCTSCLNAKTRPFAVKAHSNPLSNLGKKVLPINLEEDGGRKGGADR